MDKGKTPQQLTKAYTYQRYMRDGTVETKHAVVRSKKKTKEKNATA